MKKSVAKKWSRWVTFLSGVIGAICIAFGIVLSNNINHEYLSPLMFSIGIILTVILRVDLITKAVPNGERSGKCFFIALGNFFTAFCLGWLLKGFGAFPTRVGVDFWGAVGTGIIIGLVALINKSERGGYTIPLTFMLMFAFVYLKLPHCVVSAFYLGGIAGGPEFDSSLLGFISVVFGNVVGGLVVASVYGVVEYVRKKTMKKIYF